MKCPPLTGTRSPQPYPPVYFHSYSYTLYDLRSSAELRQIGRTNVELFWRLKDWTKRCLQKAELTGLQARPKEQGRGRQARECGVKSARMKSRPVKI